MPWKHLNVQNMLYLTSVFLKNVDTNTKPDCYSLTVPCCYHSTVVVYLFICAGHRAVTPHRFLLKWLQIPRIRAEEAQTHIPLCILDNLLVNSSLSKKKDRSSQIVVTFNCSCSIKNLQPRQVSVGFKASPGSFANLCEKWDVCSSGNNRRVPFLFPLLMVQ